MANSAIYYPEIWRDEINKGEPIEVRSIALNLTAYVCNALQYAEGSTELHEALGLAISTTKRWLDSGDDYTPRNQSYQSDALVALDKALDLLRNAKPSETARALGV